MTLVLDGSVTIAWCFEDQVSPAIELLQVQVTRNGAYVPELWRYEIPNALLNAQRRGRVSPAQIRVFSQLLAKLPLTYVPYQDPPNRLVDLTFEHSISAYDASYLALSINKGLPLATLDIRLASAAKAAGVTVVPKID